MNITFACPKCDRAVRVELEADVAEFACPACNATLSPPAGAIDRGRLERCLACGSRDVYLRKDFPQRLGVLIVVVGFGASCVTWAYSRPILTFAILFATALVDVVLYLVMPTALVCYHCGAVYRGAADMDRYAGFELDTHERHRQQRIRLAEHERQARESLRSDTMRGESPLHGAVQGEGPSTAGRVQ